ncbi:MAG: hypothetical protein JWN52_2473 [Actinomycetia bacterium]|nr:hypothetical protein [Actinomycetes bacterium]
MTISNDVARVGSHFPLGAQLGPYIGGEAVRPFGLQYATEPTEVIDLEWDQLGYDEGRQIAIVTDEDGAILPAMKHTSTKTKTSTNSDDRKPPDDDEDATGD